MPSLRWLVVLAALETATLAILLVNLATVHHEAVTSLVGPLHGACYLGVVAVAFLLGLPRRAKLLSIVPVVGGFLAVRAAGRSRATSPGGPST